MLAPDAFPSVATANIFEPSSAPTSDAGPDQTVETGADCTAEVRLDGTGSSDPDNDGLTSMWTGPFGEAHGASATVTLGPGTHTLTLTIEDQSGASSSDTLTIIVEDRTPPALTAPPPVAVGHPARRALGQRRRPDLHDRSGLRRPARQYGAEDSDGHRTSESGR
jgi:hypothetical protein